MSKGNTYENETLLHVFQNATLPLIGDAAGLLASATAGNLYFGLHTGDPGEAGTQETSECAYTSYARVAVVRSAVGFTVTNNSVSPAADVTFPAATGGTETATHFSVGTAASGAGKILYSGTVTPNISISTSVTPVLDSTTAITED